MSRVAPLRRVATFVGLAAIVAAFACGPAARSSGSDPFAGAARGSGSGGTGEIRIDVRNTNFNSGTVYAVRPGSRRRLGRVEGATDGNFRLRWPTSNQLQFEVDILGGQGCVTRPVMVDPGQKVLLTIESANRPQSDGSYSLCSVRRSR